MPENIKAKNKKTVGKTANILGIRVSGTDKEGLLHVISQKLNKKTFKKPFFIITAYSENILEAGNDFELKKAFEAADAVVADGVSVPAGAEYQKRRSGAVRRDLWLGVLIGVKILRGGFAGKKITGVGLARELLETGTDKGWKVYLLGGLPGTAGKLARKYKSVIGYDMGYENVKWQKFDTRLSKEVIKRINRYKPDLLLVALGRFEQEKWIWKNLKELRAKVIIGVGSGFDELAGAGSWAATTPDRVEKMGLKWLWRAVKDPRHIRRAWNAFPVFAWKVFRSPR